jgi:hypothetical protein
MRQRPPSSTAKEAKPRMKKVSKIRLQDLGDTAWIVAFVLVSLAGTAWLSWTFISMPSPR